MKKKKQNVHLTSFLTYNIHLKSFLISFMTELLAYSTHND